MHLFSYLRKPKVFLRHLRVPLQSVAFALCFLPSLVAAETPVRIGVYGILTEGADRTIAGLALPLETAKVINPLGLVNGKDLKPGAMLALTVDVSGKNWTIVRAIQVFGLIGPSKRLAENTTQVLGTQVEVDAQQSVPQGGWLAVSGFWQNGKIVEAQISKVAASGFAHTSGAIAPPDSTGNAFIGTTRLLRPKEADMQEGQLWFVNGPPSDGGIRADLMTQGFFVGKLDLVVMEGYASAPIASETYEVYGTGLVGFAKEANMPSTTKRQIFCGIDGKVVRKTNADMSPELVKILNDLNCLP